MGAVAQVAGAVLNSTAKSGQKEQSQVNPVSETSGISGAGNDSPDINTADVKEVGGTPDTDGDKPDTKKANDTNSSGTDWEKLAKVAGQLESMTNNQVSAPITANPISQASPLANFR